MTAAIWKRRALLAGLLLTVVLAVVSDDGVEVESAKPEPRRGAAAGSDHAPARLELERLRPAAPAGQDIDNVFVSTSWYVPPPPPPPPPPVKPSPPPPPSPPPLPFGYLGRYQDGDRLIVMLTKGDRVYTVSVGTVIENTYRVERWQDGLLELTYLPLGMKQTIGTG